jgi:hypothetical protein
MKRHVRANKRKRSRPAVESGDAPRGTLFFE